jgi:hypothetical protein
MISISSCSPKASLRSTLDPRANHFQNDSMSADLWMTVRRLRMMAVISKVCSSLQKSRLYR